MANNELATIQESFTFVPAGETKAITLTAGIITRFVSNPTKSGKQPSEKDVMQFMMLCQARALNPFVGDAYLVGYDTNSGPSFSLITAKSALDKRAESHPQFDGMESGIVVLKNGNEIERREGAICLKDEVLIGAWSIVYRKDRERPTKHDVNFVSYDTGLSKWKSDPEGMIVKVAEAGGLRKAFPNTFAGLYVAEESDVHMEAQVTVSETKPDTVKTLPEGFKRKVIEKTQEAPEPETEPEKEPAPAKTVTKKATTTKPAAKPPVEEKPAPVTEEKKPEPAKPASEAVQLSASHVELKALAKSNGIMGADLCAAAKAFFGLDVADFSEIPELNVRTMISSFEDVLEHIKG